MPGVTPPPVPGHRRRRLIPAKTWALTAVREWCDGLLQAGRTNMLVALNNAHEYPDADAVYLVSDGLPDNAVTIHKTVSAAKMNAARGWNGTGRAMLPVHAVGIRPDSKGERFLRKLAEDTGGSYVRFDDDEELLQMSLTAARSTLAVPTTTTTTTTTTTVSYTHLTLPTILLV